MAASKYPKGFNLELKVPAGDTTHESVAVIAKDEWSQLGVNVTVVKEDQGALFTDYSEGKYQAAIPMPLITSDVLVPDELALAWLVWTPGQQSFFTQYKNPTLAGEVKLANRTPNQAKRGALWVAIQRQSMQDHHGRRSTRPVAHRGAQQRSRLPDTQISLVGPGQHLAELDRTERSLVRVTVVAGAVRA